MVLHIKTTEYKHQAQTKNFQVNGLSVQHLRRNNVEDLIWTVPF